MNYSIIITLLGVGCLLMSCSKDPHKGLSSLPYPPSSPTDPLLMHYIPLNDQPVQYARPGVPVDLNTDGRTDIFFHVQLVGDPLSQEDKVQFLSTTDILTALPVNATESIPVLDQGDSISTHAFPSHSWFGASEIVLMQKRIPLQGISYWDGDWKNSTRQCMPLQVSRNNEHFNGYVELSADPVRERLVLHKAAISLLPDRAIAAGK